MAGDTVVSGLSITKDFSGKGAVRVGGTTLIHRGPLYSSSERDGVSGPSPPFLVLLPN